MPLFMAYHQSNPEAIAEVKNSHMAALPLLDQLKIKYHQFWFNEEEGDFYCLLESPDKATCNLAFQLSYHKLPKVITEVSPGNFPFTSENDGTPGQVLIFPENSGLGNRGILAMAIRPFSPKSSLQVNSPSLEIPSWAKAIIMEKFKEFKGREINGSQVDCLTGVFQDAHLAILCAQSIQQILLHNRDFSPQVIFKMGLSASPTLVRENQTLTSTLLLAQRLSHAAQDYQVLISPLAVKHNLIPNFINGKEMKCINPTEEQFLSNIFHYTELHLSNQNFSIPHLCHFAGISRPQLYRKITSITGRSPNSFLKDLKMEKALYLLQQKVRNVAEVSMEVGFNSPSYFAKC